MSFIPFHVSGDSFQDRWLSIICGGGIDLKVDAVRLLNQWMKAGTIEFRLVMVLSISSYACSI